MVWKIAKVGRLSAVTGESFPPDTEVVAALFGQEQGQVELGAAGVERQRREGQARQLQGLDQSTKD